MQVQQPCRLEGRRGGFLLPGDGGHAYPPLSVGVLVLGHELDHAPATLGDRGIVLQQTNRTTPETVSGWLLLHQLCHCVGEQASFSPGGDERPRLLIEQRVLHNQQPACFI